MKKLLIYPVGVNNFFLIFKVFLRVSFCSTCPLSEGVVLGFLFPTPQTYEYTPPGGAGQGFACRNLHFLQNDRNHQQNQKNQNQPHQKKRDVSQKRVVSVATFSRRRTKMRRPSLR